MRFTMARKCETIEMVNAAGEIVQYTMTEPSGKQRDSYLSKLLSRQTVDANGKTSVTNMEGMQAELITCCLTDEKQAVIPAAIIQEYPASTQDGLFKIAQKLAGLTEKAAAEAEEESKNA